MASHHKIRFTKSAEGAHCEQSNHNDECSSFNYPNYEFLFQSANELHADEIRRRTLNTDDADDNNHLKLTKAKNWDSLKVPERTQSMRQTKSKSRSPTMNLQRSYTTKSSSVRGTSMSRDPSLQRSFKVTKPSTTPVDDDEQDLQRLRTFTIDPKAGFINRGDSFRSRSALSNSESVPCFNGSNSSSALSSRSHSPFLAEPNSVLFNFGVSKFDVLVIGAEGVGKTVLINQFKTSDYCNLFNESSEVDSIDSGHTTVSVLLDSEESEITFIEYDNEKKSEWKDTVGSGYLIVYSIDKEATFKNAVHVIKELRKKSNNQDFRKPIVLVGNKVDLERRRCVSKEGAKSAAKHNECKFIEISVAIGHNVDKLLAGILTQVRRKSQNFNAETDVSGNGNGSGSGSGRTKLKLTATRSSATTNVSNLVAAKKQLINRLSFKKTKSVEDLFSIKNS